MATVETNEFKLETLYVQINRRRRYGHASTEKIIRNGKSLLLRHRFPSLSSLCVCFGDARDPRIEFKRSDRRRISISLLIVTYH